MKFYRDIKAFALLFVCACLCLQVAPGQVILRVSNTGANTGLDVVTPRTWNVAVTTAGELSGLTVNQALLGLNSGSQTTNPVTMTVYRGFGATGPALTSVTIPAADIGKVFNTNTVFAFTPLTLTAGAYSVQFTTAAPAGGSTAYGLKQGALSITDTNGNPVNGIYWVQDTTTTGLASTNFAATDVLADYRLSTTNIAYGNYRVGATLSTQVGLTNSAFTTVNDATEKLSTAATNYGNATVSGLSTNLLAATVSTFFTVGLNSGSVGTNTGSVQLNYSSYTNGTAASRPGGPTNIGSQIISVSGVGYRTASAGVGQTNVSFGNYRIGAVLNTNIGLTNVVINDGFSEKLGVSTNNVSANVTVSGVPAGLMSALSSTSLVVGLNSASAGTNNGSFTLGFTSDGTGTSGLSATNIGSKVIIICGVGYRLATASLASTNVNLGNFHLGATNAAMGVSLSNTAVPDGFSEGLAIVVAGSSGGGTATNLPTGPLAGGASSNVSFGLSAVNTVGTNTGSVTLNFSSSGVGSSGLAATNIGSQTVNITAVGYTGRAQWNTNSGGAWNSFANWDTAGGTPGLDGALSTNDTATFASGPVGGTTTVNLNGANPVLSTMVFSNSSSSYAIAPGSGGALTLGTAQHAGSIRVSEGSHTVSAPISLARDTSIEVTRSNDTFTISSNISGIGAQLLKSGGGKLILDGPNNTYTGQTTVGAGTLSVNGSLASAGVIIQNGGILSGIGSLAGLTTIQSGGTLSPGNTTGIETFEDGLSFESGSHLHWELTANTASGLQRGVSHDGLDVTGGDVQINSSTVLDLDFDSLGSSVNWSDPFWDNNQSWVIIKNTGSGNIFGTLSLITIGKDSTATLLSAVRPDASFSVSTDDNADYFILNYYAIPVPEPSSCALVVVGAVALASRRRRRRSSRRSNGVLE